MRNLKLMAFAMKPHVAQAAARTNTVLPVMPKDL
jgi:hypothetical protein